MKFLLLAEEVAQPTLAILAINLQPVSISGWLWPIVFLSPDLGMLGYIVNAKVGAWTYNLLHHKAVAGVLILMGIFYRHQGYYLSDLYSSHTLPLTAYLATG